MEINDEDYTVRASIINQDYGLDRLVNDKDWYVCYTIVKKASELGREDILEKLINDENIDVRTSIADQGYKLDRLANDKDWHVRYIVVKKASELGREDLLDKLANDEDKDVRTFVTEQGYGLDRLITDKDKDVRTFVTEQGYGLDRLITDKDKDVRAGVLTYIAQNNVLLNNLIVINDDFSNENFVEFLEEDGRHVFFDKYFEQLVKEKLPQMKKDEYFDKVVELCAHYNIAEFKNKEIKDILDEYIF